MKMGQTLLPVFLSFLNLFLYCGNAQDPPQASLRADNAIIPAGGAVTLICSVNASSNWKYYWFTQTTEYPKALRIKNETLQNTIRISEGGNYYCRGEIGNLVFFTEDSNTVIIKKIETLANIIQQPNWQKIFTGETITLRCEIQNGGDTQWEYRWKTSSSEETATSAEQWNVNTSVSSEEQYWCRGKQRMDLRLATRWSYPIRLTVLDKPKAVLNAEHFAWMDRWTLTCLVKTSSYTWKYYWYKDEKSSEFLLTQDTITYTNGKISISQKGLYWCRGGRGDPVYYTDFSQVVLVEPRVSSNATVTLKPDWPVVYRNETFTLTCEIQGHNTQWEYEWSTTSSHKPLNQHEFRVDSASPSHAGSYKCRGRNRRAQQTLTEWSATFNMTVSEKPQTFLSVSPSWLSPEASVTLSCDVEHPSAGWTFFWFRIVPKPSTRTYSFEPLPDSTSGMAQQFHLIDGQKYTTGYVCIAGRGNFYTNYSKPKFVWSADIYSAAFLTVIPDKGQHFTSDVVSLTCEGNSSEWRVMRFTETDQLSYICDWESMAGSTCNIYSLHEAIGVFWCESPSGQLSNAINITAQWFEANRGSFIPPFFTGLVCGIFLMAFIVMLLLCCLRRTKDPCCNRVPQSVNTNPGSATQTVSQNDAHLYSSLLHGDVSIYETIQGHRDSRDEVDNEYRNVMLVSAGRSRDINCP